MSDYQRWVDAVVTRTGPFEVVRERPWSLVVKVPTARGDHWFKENRAGTIYEAALIEALPRWAPGRVLEPLAVDAARGWSLLPDGGPILRSVEGVAWEPFLAAYAQLQRDLAPRAGEMVALGVPDLRLLDGRGLDGWLAALPIPDAVAGYLPTLRELGKELAHSPIAPSIQHDDLHDANIFAGGQIFDWGDSSVGHPFGTLLVTLRVARHVGRDADRLRDAYLEPWTDLAPRVQLLREAEVAQQLAKVGRALSWQRAIIGASAEDLAEYEESITGWLEELLADSPD
jgi:hypothetical protein